LGLRPQYVHKLGGYKIQGKEETAAHDILQASQSLEQAGADLLLVECIPAQLAEKITQQVNIPVIGIGAGANCDGQILVLHDILGITPGKTPSFSKNYMLGNHTIHTAVSAYIQDVKNGIFPSSK
jgi:3-methyl-2-oxobutanoate hydroxymethyltransferase